MADQGYPHPTWPLHFVTNADGSVTYGSVEQDSDAERKASGATIAATPRGAHLGDPTFGVTNPLFETAPLDAARLAAEIQQSDPRLDLTVTDTADMVNAARRKLTVRVGTAETPGEG